MRINPIIPIWLMGIICIILIVLSVIKRTNKYNIIRKIIIVVLLFIINLRIMVYSRNGEAISNNLDVLFVIDNTISMLAEDHHGNTARLEAVKNDCKHIVNELAGAKFSIITFNNDSQLISPYTRDTSAINEAITVMNVMDKTYAKGSSLNKPLEDIIKQLKSSSKKEDRCRILFFISDGEITNEDTLESYSSVKKYVSDGAVLGYGTSKRWIYESKKYIFG